MNRVSLIVKFHHRHTMRSVFPEYQYDGFPQRLQTTCGVGTQYESTVAIYRLMLMRARVSELVLLGHIRTQLLLPLDCVSPNSNVRRCECAWNLHMHVRTSPLYDAHCSILGARSCPLILLACQQREESIFQP